MVLKMTERLVFLTFTAVLSVLLVCCEEESSLDNDEMEDIDGMQIQCVNYDQWLVLARENVVCPYEKNENYAKRYFESGSGTEEGFTFKIDEIMVLDNSLALAGECGKEHKCSVTFTYYDRSLFKDSLIGKEITVYAFDGYSSVFYVVRHKNGELIAVANLGNEFWPSELAPEVKVEQDSSILSECEPICIKSNLDSCGELLPETNYDIVIHPPLEIKVEGKSSVVVRNGEVVRSEGYEYFVRSSSRAHENDPDGELLWSGTKYIFDFFILNTDALK